MAAKFDHGELEALRRCAFFSGLADADLEEVARLARRRTFAARSLLFRRSGRADSGFLVLSGRVKISRVSSDGQEVILRIISPGEVFAVAAALSGKDFPADAEAAEDSVVLAWGAAALERLMRRFPAIALNAVPMLTERIREIEDRLRELMTERVERRIAHTILRLVRQTGRKADQGVEIAMPMTRQTLSELAGTTLHTASRTLSAWEKQGLVKCRRGRITVLQPHRLVELAEDLA